MRALRIHQFGGRVEIDDVPEPTATDGEVSVRMRYVALNPLDVWVSRGTAAGGNQQLPFVIGVEGVGEIDGAWVLVHGEGVGTRRDGLARDVATVPRAACVPLPQGVDLTQAAAVGVAGVTAWRLAHELGGTTPDDIALVFGAGGGVGAALLQVLGGIGCRVIAQTGSEQKVGVIHALGAGEVIVAEAGAMPDLTPPPTVIFDPLGGAATARAITLLAPHGRILLFGTSMAPTAEVDLRALYRKAGRILGYSGTIEAADRLRPAIEHVLAEIEAGRMRLPIEVLPLGQAADGLDRIFSRQVEGKLVLDLSR